jgi:hypothetical protein
MPGSDESWSQPSPSARRARPSCSRGAPGSIRAGRRGTPETAVAEAGGEVGVGDHAHAVGPGVRREGEVVLRAITAIRRRPVMPPTRAASAAPRRGSRRRGCRGRRAGRGSSRRRRCGRRPSRAGAACPRGRCGAAAPPSSRRPTAAPVRARPVTASFNVQGAAVSQGMRQPWLQSTISVRRCRHARGQPPAAMSSASGRAGTGSSSPDSRARGSARQPRPSPPDRAAPEEA